MTSEYSAACPIPESILESRITGKERDAESGLDYFGARYYGSTMGRFLSPDEFAGGPVDVNGGDPTPPGPLPYAEITNPQSLNKYAYTYNNPLRYIDPSGHVVVLSGDQNDKDEEKKRILANASRKGEAALFKTVTGKNGQTRLIVDKDAAANFKGSHSKGFNMLVQAIEAKGTATVTMWNFDSETRTDGRGNATVYLDREVAGIDRPTGAPMRDSKGNVIPNPFHIIAGHELFGHARLYLLGDPGYWQDGPSSKAFQVENQLRKEQGLPLRPNEVP